MRAVALLVGCLIGGVVPAVAEPSCPGHPDAIGTSRTVTVDPAALPRIGTMQYKQTLPLNDHEVAITFDDGPLPPYSNRVLDTLAANCVKVTYFLVGQMARAYPDTVRRIYNAGHTIGTHSQHHPFNFGEMGQPRIEREVDDGIASVTAALGDARAVSPFFRIPGLARSRQVEGFLTAQSIAIWSADEVADDWFHGISASQIVRRAINRIEAKGHRGVLLLHDIHPATAMALPTLLKELKARGYRIVQVVAPGERPATLPERPAAVAAADASGWPRLLKTDPAAGEKPNKTEASADPKPLAPTKAVHRHRKHLVHVSRDAPAPVFTAVQKPTPQTAAAGPIWFPLWR